MRAPEPPNSFSVLRVQGVLVVELHGEFDYNDREIIGTLLGSDARSPLVVDLRACSFMDSSILAVLLRARAERRHQALALVLKPGSDPRRALDISGLLPVFYVAEEVHEAVIWFQFQRFCD